MTQDLFTKKLSAHKFSTTEPRKIIFSALLGNEPLSINRLISIVAQQVDKATVYRTINLFENLGITQRVNSGWKYKIELTDMFGSHHHHMHCRICQKITSTIEDSELEILIQAVADRSDFRLESHQIELFGVCKNCQAKN